MRMTRSAAIAAGGGVLLLLLGAGMVNRVQSRGGTRGQAEAHNNVRPAIRWKQFEYTCEGGAKVTVWLSNITAKVMYEGQQYLMRQTRSADGNRYSDGKVVWWGKGNGGFLQEDTPEGNGKMLAQDCKLIQPAAEAGSGLLTGTVSYREKMALPPNSVIHVQLLDVSGPNVPSVIAEQEITLGERQVPVPFDLEFDPEKIDPKHSYEVRAKIMVGDETRFLTQQPRPVVLGSSENVPLVLSQVQK